jgi:hypothetical protein
VTTRTENLLEVTKRLILMTGGALLLIALLFGVTLIFGRRFMVSWACFGCGLVGGFVSIQQRLHKIGDSELQLLSQSWFEIALIPVYGGIFALVLYVGFLSQIVTGSTFPAFAIKPFHSPPTTQDIQDFFGTTYPATGMDLAKLFFWCFAAGFSERLVPQIISKNSAD